MPNWQLKEALNKALENIEIIRLLASMMGVETGEPGHHFGMIRDDAGKYYDCRLSPDSYRAFLSTQLIMVIEAAALGKESPLGTYPPWYLDLEKRKEEIRAQGRLIEEGDSDNAEA